MAPAHIVPGMRSIDIHAHLTPQCFWRATAHGGDWHTLQREQDARGREYVVVGRARQALPPRARWTPEERLADMDSLGVDVHVLSPYSGFYNYHLDTSVALATATDSNNEIHEMVVQWPDRRLRGDAPTYLVLPEDPALVAVHRKAHHGFLPLSRRRPKVTDGEHLLEVRIRRRGAIDVPATLDKLRGLPVVGRLHDFVGQDLLLSEQEFPHAVVTKVWRTGERRRSSDKITGGTLADALATDAFRPRALFDRFRIDVLATTNSPLDPLEHHEALGGYAWQGRIIPTFRPDPVIDPDFDGFLANLASLGKAESHGCIRLSPDDMRKLWPLAPVGTRVYIT